MRGARELACVIPAYEAGRTLGAVVRGVRAVCDAPWIIVVDDGSRDDTAAVSARLADETIRLRRNQGKGGALRAGFAAALARGVEAVLTIDADGQHDPRHAPRLVAALAWADIAIGARCAPRRGMPVHRRLSNALSSAAVSLCAGSWLPDSQSGFRTLRSAVLRTVAGEGNRYEFETDLLIRAARAGYRIAHVPVPTIYGPPSHFRAVGDGLRVARTIWRHRAAAFR